MDQTRAYVLIQSKYCRGKSGEGRKLVATEEGRTQPWRQVGPVPSRTHQWVQPALARLSIGNTRIGISAHHRSRSTSLI